MSHSSYRSKTMYTYRHESWCLYLGVLLCVLFMGTLWSSCRVTRHIPDDAQVVSRVHIEGDAGETELSQLRMSILQKPYHRTFGFLPISTWLWHNDTTRTWTRWRNRVGSEPPLYDVALTERTRRAMGRVLSSDGYMDAEVSYRVKEKGRKTQVTYEVAAGEPRRLSHVQYIVEDDLLADLIKDDASRNSVLKLGDRLSRNTLESERTRLTSMMRNAGYWDFNKEHVSYIADTMAGSTDVELSVLIAESHEVYRIGTVYFVTDFDLMDYRRSERGDSLVSSSTRTIGDGYVLQHAGEQCYLRSNTLIENCSVVPGELYTERAVKDTYAAFCRLPLLKYVNLRIEPRADHSNLLDCYVCLTPQNLHSVQFELDGTNTSGDLGFATALTYQHRNLMRGSEVYTIRLKGGYESLTGNVADLVNDNYTEYAVETGIDFPKFLFPFLNEETRRRSRASSAIRATFSWQDRPEYTRIISQASFGYKWYADNLRRRHVFDVIDLSYVYLPKRSDSFMEIIQNAGPISYSSYQSHLILSMGYNLYMGNTTQQTIQRKSVNQDVWTLRINPEIAGNALMGISHIFSLPKEDGSYVVLDQPFEQYVRLDVDWAYSKYLTDRSRLAFHVAGGIAIPYGNSRIMPFEKRYYSGGANSVRGWSVRTLGPGSYCTDGAKLDYFNQCGDVRLDLNMELRSRLFWKIEFAAFLDAGNVWTWEEYESQKGGAISKDFYRQLAASWGMGVRLVTDFVVLRLDMGVKAYDPTLEGSDAWRITDPLKSSNRTIHFAVGYPF